MRDEIVRTRRPTAQFPLLLSGLDQQALADLHPVALELVPFAKRVWSSVKFPRNAEQSIAAAYYIVERLLDESVHSRQQPPLGSGIPALLVVNGVHIVDQRVERRSRTSDGGKLSVGHAGMGNPNTMRGQKVETTRSHR